MAKKKKSAKKSAKRTTKKAAKKTAKKTARKPVEGDILRLILDHHKPLKTLIQTLKDSDTSLPERRAAFEEFAPLLVSHAKAEEEVLYVYMKKNEELREDGFEGDVEHGLADQMLEEIKRTNDPVLWSARVKVVAELVEHHIKEEESDMFPEIRDESEPEERVRLGETYLSKWEALISKGGEDAPSERAKAEPAKPSLTHS